MKPKIRCLWSLWKQEDYLACGRTMVGGGTNSNFAGLADPSEPPPVPPRMICGEHHPVGVTMRNPLDIVPIVTHSCRLHACRRHRRELTIQKGHLQFTETRGFHERAKRVDEIIRHMNQHFLPRSRAGSRRRRRDGVRPRALGSMSGMKPPGTCRRRTSLLCMGG